MRIRFHAATIEMVAALLIPAAAAAQQANAKVVEKPVTRVFMVADLVTPTPDFELSAPKDNTSPFRKWKTSTQEEAAEELTRMITTVVRPKSWSVNGGQGRIEFFDIGSAYVVANSGEVVDEVAKFLESLRKLQEVNISVEVRYLKLPAGVSAKLGLTLQGDMPVTLDDKELRKVLEAIQENSAASVMQAPKLTLFNGQVATIATGEQRKFTTGLETANVNGGVVLVPKVTTIDLGDSITLCGRVSADERSAMLRINATRKRLLSDKVEKVPVTTEIVPVFEGGSQGMPIAFKQLLEAPSIKTNSAERNAVLPSGRTLLVGSWTEPTRKTGEMEVVVLATVRVFRDTANPAKTEPKR